MSKINKIFGREILASGGAPSLEVTVELSSGAVGEASVSYGASAGSREATVLLDNDKTRYSGKGMLQAVKNVNDEIAKVVLGCNPHDLSEIDHKMINLDGTENKSRLGGNAILGVSMAIARASANEQGIPLWKYLKDIYDLTQEIETLPKPMVVMIEGGKHADKTTDLQEYLISSLGNKNVNDHIRVQMEIYSHLRKILKSEGLSVNVGNEGAFAPNGIISNEKPMEYLLLAINNAGYVPGVDAGISIDAAASEYFNKDTGKYSLSLENRDLTSDELIGYYCSWITKYPFVSWEDMLSEFDWDSWPKLLVKIGNKFPLIADDLTVTNALLWQKALDIKAASGILIKLNQAGSVTETVEACRIAIENNFWKVPSHRGGGETNDTFMVDLAVAVGAEYIKCGPTRGERVCKYNRLMRIEEELR